MFLNMEGASFMTNKELKIAVIGLGYVGLPLAIEFGKKHDVIGYDVDSSRIEELEVGYDRTLEVSSEELCDSRFLSFTTAEEALDDCNCYIVTVPTPINNNNQPDLNPLLKASKLIGKALGKDNIVIYESTVYPGATEEECVPVLEYWSGLIFNKDFFCGYSPERINPGDKEHRLPMIKKVTSGSNPKAADFVDDLYKKIITAGTHRAESIRVAEAAKVIENTQRDLNIALVNELAIIFNKLGIDTEAVLDAAGSKWNFLPFKPGLVGGHCIGVDPYYLTYKAQSVGYKPEVILAGRRMNDNMASYVASQLVKSMVKNSIVVDKSNVLVMGVTFKEDCPDFRNTKVIDIVEELKEYNCNVDVYDPVVDKVEVEKQLGVRMCEKPSAKFYDGVIVAVGHRHFKQMGIDGILELTKPNHVIYDVKHILPHDSTILRL